MITQFLMDMLAGFIGVIIGVMPDFPPEVSDGIQQVPLQVAGIVDVMTRFGFIVPFGFIGTGLSIVFAGLIAGVVIKIGRIVASFATLGGGM